MCVKMKWIWSVECTLCYCFCTVFFIHLYRLLLFLSQFRVGGLCECEPSNNFIVYSEVVCVSRFHVRQTVTPVWVCLYYKCISACCMRVYISFSFFLLLFLMNMYVNVSLCSPTMCFFFSFSPSLFLMFLCTKAHILCVRIVCLSLTLYVFFV